MSSFSIITPTLCRESLNQCVASIDNQTFKNFEHIIVVDDLDVSPFVQDFSHPQRNILCCKQRFNDFGNTPRHRAWYYTKGEYLIYLDDDNFFEHPGAMSDIAAALESKPDWAVFPIMRHGSIFFNNPPGLCMSDTANIVVRREIGQWPSGPEYTMDGIFIERLKLSHPNYMAFPNVRPIINVPTSSQGQ